ncbi:MAG: hypothetical protein IKE66_12470 [Hyphomicrobium sp.]|nr:hypothetical protein [Hyphomicrobium sp.]
MLTSLSVFTFVISVFGKDGRYLMHSEEIGPSWFLLFCCLGFVGIISLICAKRLLNCRRPIWLALAVAPFGLLLSLVFASGMQILPELRNMLALYLALFALPVFITCALYDAED